MNIIDQNPHGTKEKILAACMNPIRPFLPTSLIEQWCRDLGYSWRERMLGPVVTLLACVWKHMQPKVVSVRDVEDGIAEWCGNAGATGRSGSDFCQARARLPKAVLERALEHVGAAAARMSSQLFRDMPVWLVDGSSVRVPNTLALDAHYGRSNGGSAWSRFPIARLLLLVCAGSGAVAQILVGAYRDSEPAMFLRLIEKLAAGGLLVADRAFGSFIQCWRIQMRGSHLLARRREDRKAKKVRRLGYRDKLVELSRPTPRDSAFPELLAECPPKIYVRIIERSMHRRGYRSWPLMLVTTLLDPIAFPANELVALYLQRWDIETVMRTLKTHYGMARLAGKTPDVVEKEIFSTVLAYNCVAALVCESGEAPKLVSPMRAKHIVMRHAHYMSHAPTWKLVPLYQAMLKLLATALQLPQERGPQPRALLRVRSRYPTLRCPRQDWRTNYLVA